MSTLVFDLKNLAFRAAWANKALVGPDGKPSGALYGILRMLTSALYRFPDTTKLVFAADPVVEHGRMWRAEEFPEYKASRTASTDEDAIRLRKSVAANLLVFRQMASVLPCTWLEDPDAEADDLIAWYAACTEPHEKVVIISRDWDLMQLAAYPNVTVAYPENKGFHLLMASNFAAAIDPLLRKRSKAKHWPTLALTPRLYLVLKSWVGDKSDGIPGLVGVKEATGMKMLQRLADSLGGAHAIPSCPGEAWSAWWRACQSAPTGPGAADRKLAASNPNGAEVVKRNYKLIVLIDGVQVQSRMGFQALLDEDFLASWLAHYRFESLLQGDQIDPYVLTALRKLRHA